jgi:hypothetical protein
LESPIDSGQAGIIGAALARRFAALANGSSIPGMPERSV